MIENTNNILKMIENKEITIQEGRDLLKQNNRILKIKKSGYHFNHNEVYLRDHKVLEKKVLLGVTHCSLAIEEIAKSEGYKDQFIGLKKIIFLEAIIIDEGEHVDLVIKQYQDQDKLKFNSLFNKNSDTTQNASASGEVIYKKEVIKNTKINIEELLENGKSDELLGIDLYKQEKEDLIWHGSSLQTVKTIHYLNDSILAELELTNEIIENSPDYYVHPAILDGAITASVIGSFSKDKQAEMCIPFAIKKILSYRRIPNKCVCLIRKQLHNEELISFDIDIYNPEGLILLEIEGFSCKIFSLKENNEISISNKTTKKKKRVNHKTHAEKNNKLELKISEYIKDKIKKIQIDSTEEIDEELNFLELGVDSANLINVSQEIETELGLELYPTLFFEYQNVRELAQHFSEEYSDNFNNYFGINQINIEIETNEETNDSADVAKLTDRFEADIPITPASPKILTTTPQENKVKGIDTKHNQDEIAIIGVAGKLAKSNNIDEFWNNIIKGQDLITEIPIDHFDYKPYYDKDFQKKDKIYSKWGSFIDNVDKFDARFFNIVPIEAEYMDPQIRILMEVLYETAENAGYIKEIRGSNTGLYVGVCFHDYVIETSKIMSQSILGMSATNNSNRPSYNLDLKGPSVSIDTACSSSLVALHLACNALRNNECEMAFVGGVNLLLSIEHYKGFCSLGALSKTGKCYSFDKKADGYVPGEAIVAVLIKPLTKAIEDSDHIYGVIKGSAINHGGHSAGPTAPSVKQEAEVIKKAIEDANINVETISYLEAHGTGTELGDPIEVQGIKRAFGQNSKNSYCALGSAKAYVGHTEGAAGLVGVIKVLLQMKHKKIPVIPNFKELNSIIQIEHSPLYINTEVIDWEREGENPRRAGVSSFGIGGAYAHVILEEWEVQQLDQKAKSNLLPQLLIFSGKNKERIKEYAIKLNTFINNRGRKGLCIQNIAYTLQVGREEMEERLVIVVNNKKELAEKLIEYIEGIESVSIFQGNIKKNREKDDPIYKQHHKDIIEITVRLDKTKQEYADRLDQIAALWSKGFDIDWELLYSNIEESEKPRRISLPTYSFESERHWIKETDKISNETKHKKEIKEFNEQEILQMWNRCTEDGESKLDIGFDGIDSLEIVTFINELMNTYNITIDMGIIMDSKTPRELMKYIKENISTLQVNETEQEQKVTSSSFKVSNDFIKPERWFYLKSKNKLPIVFVLTALRHGSSLTNFILNANPDLYAPQGLFLLPFTNLAEREGVLKNSLLYLEDGLLHTIQDLWEINDQKAKELILDWTEKRIPIQEVYNMIQEKCYPRILVDRGTIYSLDLKILKRSEKMFESVKYIHLIRHPYSVLRSGTALLKKTALLRNFINKKQFDSEEIDNHLHKYIDETWSTTHINIVDFSKSIKNKRYFQMKFEDLTTNTQIILENVCKFLNVSYDDIMLRPYDVEKNVALHNKKNEEGISSIDPKVMKRNQIDSKNADSWKRNIPKRSISPSTRYFSQKLGYILPEKSILIEQDLEKPFINLNKNKKGAPIIIVPGSGGILGKFQEILFESGRPVFGVQMVNYAPYTSFKDLAYFFIQKISFSNKKVSIIAYSSGAFIAWEMVPILLEKGYEVDHLILIDRDPLNPDNIPIIDGLEESFKLFLDKFYKNDEMHNQTILGLTMYGKIFYNLKKEEFSQLVEKLISGGSEKKELYKIFTDFMHPRVVNKEMLDEFIVSFLRVRVMIENNKASDFKEIKTNKIYISNDRNTETGTIEGIKKIVIKNCDHLSILSKIELKDTLFSILNNNKSVNVPKHGIPPVGKIKKLKSMVNDYYQKLRILIRKLAKYK